MERYCAYQERCHFEVNNKLREMRMIPEAIDHIIGHLIQENYLNEERFARAFVRGKFRIKKWGRTRLINELKSRKISSYNIKAGLSEIDTDAYLNTFHDLAEKRWQQIKGTGKNLRKKKFADYMFYRGWETHLVYDKLRELE
jgi:regulatory protein